MTNNDHALLRAVRNACDKFCLGLADDRLSHDDHIEMVLLFLRVTDRILQRLIDKSVNAEPVDTDGDGL